MKIKRILCIAIVFCLCMCTTISVLAHTEYGNVWLNKGSYIGKSFSVSNTHTGKTGVTLKLESTSTDSWAQVYLTNPKGQTVLTTVKLDNNRKEAKFTLTNAVKGTYKINYIGTAGKNGMRLMCWMY